MKENKPSKMAKDLRANDVILSGGQQFTVRRVHGPTRKDWNHTTVYFRQGKSTTVVANTEFEIVPKTLVQIFTEENKTKKG